MTTGTIFDIKKFAIHDGPGIRTTVFFKGCPLNCLWCHNPESRNKQIEKICVRLRRGDGTVVSQDKTYGREVSVDEVFAEVMKDRVFYEESGGGVTCSGGEPLIQTEFLYELLARCKDADIHTAVDTSGFVDFKRIRRAIEVTDLFLYDIKLADSSVHEKFVGVPNERIIHNLRELAGLGADIMLRVPLIPGITDTDANINGVLSLLSSIKSISKVGLLPYNSLAEDKLERFGMVNQIGHLQRQDESALRDMAKKFTEAGYAVTVGG
ncbi:MAG: glycyl-radical enzyme activating protein [Candidatus Zixiibacteriota bacterium]